MAAPSGRAGCLWLVWPPLPPRLPLEEPPSPLIPQHPRVDVAHTEALTFPGCLFWRSLGPWPRDPQARLAEAREPLGGRGPRAGPAWCPGRSTARRGKSSPWCERRAWGGRRGPAQGRAERHKRRPRVLPPAGERVRAGEDVPPPGEGAVHQRAGDRYGGAGGRTCGHVAGRGPVLRTCWEPRAWQRLLV